MEATRGGRVSRQAAWALGLCLALSLGPARGSGFEDGYAACQRGDYPSTLAAWRRLAVEGDARAQRNLASRLARGDGLPRDDVEALRWATLAMREGTVGAYELVETLRTRMSRADVSRAEAIVRAGSD